MYVIFLNFFGSVRETKVFSTSIAHQTRTRVGLFNRVSRQKFPQFILHVLHVIYIARVGLIDLGGACSFLSFHCLLK